MAFQQWSITDEDHSVGFYRTMAIIFFLLAVGLVVLGAMADAIIVGLVLGYLVLAFGMHLGHGEVAAAEIFFGAWTKTISLPTFIFELDADGCIQMLLYRFILGPLLCLLIGIVVGILGTLLAMLVAAVTFPFHIVRFVRCLIG